MVPAPTEATDASTSAPLVDKETLDLTRKLVEYDQMMETARRLKDERAERIIAECKDVCLKLNRGMDLKLKDELDRDLMRTQQDREALRARLRDEDREAMALKKAAKIDKMKTDAAARARKDEREALEKLKMRIDQRWEEEDFGQGLTEEHAKDFGKKAKNVIVNYRLALNRLKMRCPELPEHVQIQWEGFLDDFPITWLHDHRRTLMHNIAGKEFLRSVDALFEAGLR